MVTTRKSSSCNGRNRLLEALKPADFSLLAPNLQDISLTQGDVLKEAGDTITYVYFPQSGMISLLAVMQNGSAVETATIGREGAVGAMSGLGSRIAPYRSVVQIEGTASRIAAARFETAVNWSASIKDLLVRYSDGLMMMVQQSAGCNALHGLEARLCRWLLQTRDRSDSNRLGLTQEFLSQMLGVRRTSLTAIACDLQAAGLIHYRRGLIQIIDRSGLEAKACECYSAIRRRGEEVFSHTHCEAA
jgi:CRP-like cAMP-binding protein